MMEWTDRHCRYLHRLISKNTLLYTEMITPAAILNGDQSKILNFDETEHPVALQLGGSEPKSLAAAVKIVEAWGYDEVNLNIGCPSDRVKSGSFGVILMRSPDLVADCVKAMLDASKNVDISVKCRIGVDEDDPYLVLPEFIEMLPPDMFEQIGDFFETMPKLIHVVNVKNPKTEVDNEVVLQGLESFFG